MKRSLFFIFSIAAMLSLSACIGNTARSHTNESETASKIISEAYPTSDVRVDNKSTDDANSSKHSEAPLSMPKISIQIGNRTFHATLYDNFTANALMERLPLNLDMQELNGNEKFFYFVKDLPSDSIRVGKIKAGDLMLYGSDCLVLFYESFSTSYSYTRLGRIEDTTGLAEALGGGRESVTLKIEE